MGDIDEDPATDTPVKYLLCDIIYRHSYVAASYEAAR